MCGQVGMIFGSRERSQEDLDYLKWLFVWTLLVHEKRGPHATGVAWLKRGGEHSILKSPMRASHFGNTSEFREFFGSIDSDVTWLAGHTRWQTRGDASNNANNHPIRAGNVIGTHNGTVLNADYLFERFDLPRHAEVDSEIIFRLADSTLHDGRIDVPAFKSRLALCRGLISAVLASKSDPEAVVVIKGNKPLTLRYSARLDVLFYASEASFLDVVLAGMESWKGVSVKPMSLARFNCDSLPDLERLPLRFLATPSAGGFQRFTGREDGSDSDE